MSPSNSSAHPPSQPGNKEDALGCDIDEVTGATADVAVPDAMPDKASRPSAAGDQDEGPGKAEDLIDLGPRPTPLVSVAPEVTEPATPPQSERERPGGLLPDLMSSSTATLKPVTSPTTTTATQLLSIESAPYVDPTPPTPTASQPPSRTPSNAASGSSRHPHSSPEPSPTRRDASFDDKRDASEDDDQEESGSRSEIQSIMEQFSEEGGGPGEEEVMSPRLEIASPLLGSGPIHHPPRKSSLEPLAPSIAQQLQDLQGLHLSNTSPTSARQHQQQHQQHQQHGRNDEQASQDEKAPPVPPKDNGGGPGGGQTLVVAAGSKPPQDDRQSLRDSPLSPSLALHRPPLPEPEPEPALPFDFHRFLEQLRNKKADPVARYLKSFLSEFSKRQWLVHEQVKIISDFLAFIANKMAQCEVWRDVSDAEFDNAREGMEKLVMNRLYTQTFSPAIPPPQPIPGAKPRRRGGERPMGPGRRGQHQEDVERDEILSQKIQIYSWTREEHLDIPPVSESGKRFLELAQQELLKIKSYRAPRDKIICVLNCCKVIFGLLKHSKSDSSADSFMPMLIYVVLHANPEHLVSNVQYILRFRNQEKLGGEAGYYLSSLMGAIQFIENMDRTTLTITDEEFERNVEAAVSAIAEKHRAESPPPPLPPPRPSSEKPSSTLQPPSSTTGGSSSSSPRPSVDADRHHNNTLRRPATPSGRASSSSDGKDSGGEYYSGASGDEKAAISGLLRTIQRPLSTIGRIFSDETTAAGDHAGPSGSSSAPTTPAPPPTQHQPLEADGERRRRQAAMSAEEAAARQASAEAAEAQRLHRAEHATIVETLAGMFPDLDREVISDVVYQKEGRVGLAVDACLALSA
ncbi:hypothetical protein VTK73DRAFT_4250 [Phialemonium thermophilum]|uniref:Vacuolar protein sorting-associated protein 9a n=1 Tax=Phialemonium thermophilum TaxID=223376 RepID=A0ABR3WUY6_9PEZI